nr:FAD-binding oxidoreductase [Promicromonospora panici]
MLPDSPSYERLRKPAVPLFHDTRPQAVVLCGTPADVAETLAFARRHGLRVAPRSGGHCFAGRSSTDGIVVDLSPMSAVDVVDGVVTVGAGARLGDLYASLDARGLTVPAGCGPDVGIAGLTLGGGLGVLGRSYGLTSDRLLGARVVLADGQVVDCDARHHADLFWALRGAVGGNFGVVTSLTFANVPAPRVTTFHQVWANEHAARVVGAWQRWSPDAPDRLAASLLVTVPADVVRPPVLNVFGMLVGGEPEVTDLLDAFTDLAGAAPVSTAAAPASYAGAKRYLADLGARMAGAAFEHGHSFSRSEFFDAPLPDAVVEALVRNLGDTRRGGQARELDFMPWGGAYNRVPVDATAFPHRTARFLVKHAVVVEGDASRDEREEARAWLHRSWGIVHPWGSGGVYPNFPDPDLPSWARAYHGPNFERLRQVKAAYDPDGFFRFPQSIPAPRTGHDSVDTHSTGEVRDRSRHRRGAVGCQERRRGCDVLQGR